MVILRSSDASNLKAMLKKVIRDVTNQKEDDEDDLQTMAKDVGSSKLFRWSLIDVFRAENCSIMICRSCMITLRLARIARLLWPFKTAKHLMEACLGRCFFYSGTKIIL